MLNHLSTFSSRHVANGRATQLACMQIIWLVGLQYFDITSRLAWRQISLKTLPNQRALFEPNMSQAMQGDIGTVTPSLYLDGSCVTSCQDVVNKQLCVGDPNNWPRILKSSSPKPQNNLANHGFPIPTYSSSGKDRLWR